MMLTEVAPVPENALPLDAFKAHLRLGTGFGTETLQDEVLMSFLRAALAAIEARTGKALLQRSFVLLLDHWDDPTAQPFPISPVAEVSEVLREDAAGGQEVIDTTLYRLLQDTHFPSLRPTGSCLPLLPFNGRIRITFKAGLSQDWGGLPADLAQSVMMLAAHYYEYRDMTQLHGGCMPFGVSSLIERYRALRISTRAVQ